MLIFFLSNYLIFFFRIVMKKKTNQQINSINFLLTGGKKQINHLGEVYLRFSLK